MKDYTTQERLAKISELLDKVEKHYGELDQELASHDYRSTLDTISKRTRRLGERLEPWDID